MEKKVLTLDAASSEVETSSSNPEDIKKAQEKFRENYSMLSAYSHNPLLEEIENQLREEKNQEKIEELLKEKGKCLLSPLFDLFSIAINSNIETKDGEPVLVYSFAVWRDESLKILEELTKGFPLHIQKELASYLILKIDYEFLPQFVKKAWMRHAVGLNVYNFGVQLDPALLAHEKGNLYYKRLVKAISKWLIHLELICDLVDRLKKYQILDVRDVQVFQKCKSKWKADSEGVPMRHIIKSCTWNMALKLHDNFATTFYSLLRSFAIFHFPFTFTLSLGMLKSLLKGSFASGAVNYSVLGYFGVLTAGLVAALAMQMSRQKLTDQRAIEDLGVLVDSFKVSTSNIRDLLRQANVIVADLVKNGRFAKFQDKKNNAKANKDSNQEEEKGADSEELKEPEGIRRLKEILEMLGEKKKPTYSYEEIEAEELGEKHYLVDYFKTSLVDKDWVHITKVNIEQAKVNEEMVGSLLKLSLRPRE